MSDNRGEELQVTDQQTAAGLRPRGSASRYGGQRDREAPIGPKARGGATRGDQEAGLWPEDREETLLPAENFGDQPAGERFATLLRLNEPTTASGPDSPTIALWLGCRCAGWPRTPTGREFYEAVRAKRPTSRQRAILDAWANQADWTEVLQALGRARLHHAGAGRGAAPERPRAVPDRAERQPLGKAAGRAARPVSREGLRLPEPARTLWTRIRDPLKTALVSLSGGEPQVKLGEEQSLPHAGATGRAGTSTS